MEISTTAHYNKNDEYTLTIWVNEKIPNTFRVINRLDEKTIVKKIFSDYVKEVRLK
jgi:hypothetical protein